MGGRCEGRLLAGEKEIAIEHRGLEQRRVRFAESSLARLHALFRALEIECAKIESDSLRQGVDVPLTLRSSILAVYGKPVYYW